MANGSTHALLTLDPPGANLQPEEDVARAAGQAVADAAIQVCRAIFDYQADGLMAPGTREAGGSTIAKIVVMMLDSPSGDDAFIDEARAAGSRLLRHRFMDGHDDALAAEAAIDMAIDSVFEIVTRVVETERTYRAAWAN